MAFLSVPCKRGAETSLVKPIEHYIKGNLGTGEAASCKKGLEYLQTLRNDILIKLDDAHDSTAKQIELYCDLLENLEQRIPLTNQDIPIPFKWYDCFSGSSKIFKSSMKGYNAGFDRCCMLFNLAACHSQIARSQNIKDETGLKIATKSFQVAAGMFDYVKTILPSFYTQSPTWDMSTEALTGYSTIMLAQAQECVFRKAESGDMSPSLLAKVANQAAVLYTEALTTVTLPSLRPYLPKDWASNLSTKAALMEVYAEYYESEKAAAELSYGVQIARLKKTLALIKKTSKVEGVKEFQAKVEKTLERAEKDNSLIYHDRPVDIKGLPPIEVTAVAKKLPVSFPLAGKPPKELFKSLLPMPVHSAMQVADGVRRQLVGAEMTRLRQATDTCNGVMASLNLPAAVQSENELSDSLVPKSLLQKAASIRQAGGIKSLKEKINSLADGNMRNTEILNDIYTTINEEELTDKQLRQQYGDKWNRQESSKLNACWRTEIDKHRELLKQARQTDKGLTERFNVQEAAFDHLSGSEEELKCYVASEMEKEGTTSPTTGGSNSAKQDLRRLCEQVETMKKERADLQKQLEQIAVPDCLSNEFLKLFQSGGTINAQEMASEAINKALESARDCVRESLDKQTKLLEEIQVKCEKAFGKKKDGGASALTTLLLASECYDQLIGDVGQGINFYADLTNILVRFQTKVNDFVFARQTEKKELMKDIAKEISVEKTGEVPPRPPPTYVTAGSAGGGANAPVPSVPNQMPPPVYGGYPGGMPGFWPGYGMAPVPPQGYNMGGQAMPPPMYGMYGFAPPYAMPGLPPQPNQQPPPSR